ncbi:MAG: WG repeat-containing protein [Clostridia bacterium]|nr:WG repeat-containing protein [Clostridia bacterium]
MTNLFKKGLLVLSALLMSGTPVFAEESLNIIKPYEMEGYYVFENQENYGICTSDHEIVIPANSSLESLNKRYFIVSDDGEHYGLVDENNQVIIPIQYEKLEREDDSDLIVGKKEDGGEVLYWFVDGKLQTLDLKDKRLGTNDQNGFYRDYFAVIDKKISRVDRKFWDVPLYIMNKSGDIISDLTFKYFYAKENGHSVVETADGKFGLLDEKGVWILEPVYDYISPYDTELKRKSFIIAKKDGLYGGYDSMGNKVLNTAYTHMAFVNSDYILASTDNNKTQSVLDLEGNVLLTVKNKRIIDRIEVDGKPYYICEKGIDSQNDSRGLLRADGSWLIQPQFNSIGYNETYGYFACSTYYHGLYYYNKKGQSMTYIDSSTSGTNGDYYISKTDGRMTNKRIENCYGELVLKGFCITKWFDDGFYIAEDYDTITKILDGHNKVIFTTDQMEFAERVGDIFIFRHDYDEGFTLLNTSMEAFDNNYTKLFECEGQALWAYNGKMLENYDMQGHYRFSIDYDPIEFYNGQLISKPINAAGQGVRSDWMKYGSDPNKLYGLIDPNTGEIVLEVKYPTISEDKYGAYMVKDEENHWGVVAKNGDWIIEPAYANVISAYDYDLKKITHYRVQDDNELWGIVDIDGDVLLPTTYMKISQVLTPTYAIVEKYQGARRGYGNDYDSKVRE